MMYVAIAVGALTLLLAYTLTNKKVAQPTFQNIMKKEQEEVKKPADNPVESAADIKKDNSTEAKPSIP